MNRTTEYRDFVEHRIMVALFMGAEIDKKREALGPQQTKVPNVRYTFGESRMTEYITAVEFCESLVTELRSIIQIVCTDLLQSIESNSYSP